MIRLPISLMCAGLAPQLVAQPGAVESIPADHPEPITIRILNGKNGLPLPHLHLALIAGYDERDIRHHLWGEEVSTDSSGEARLPQGLVDFGFLQVSLRKAKACRRNPQGERYNLATIRRDGLSTPNDCSILRMLDRPGVLTIFARSAGIRTRAPLLAERSTHLGLLSNALCRIPCCPPHRPQPRRALHRQTERTS
jgi:hypothetical protein